MCGGRRQNSLEKARGAGVGGGPLLWESGTWFPVSSLTLTVMILTGEHDRDHHSLRDCPEPVLHWEFRMHSLMNQGLESSPFCGRGN